MLIKFIVASKNPVKVKATLLGFKSYFSGVEIEGVNVESGVADQPMSNTETLTGARNRAENARQHFKEADYWVGIEGGIEPDENGLTAFAWIVITDTSKRGESRTTSFQLPAKVRELIEQGFELGVANDILFNKENSKQKTGAVGILTNNQINRTELYKQAVQLALIPFLNNDLY
jgi:inosine/xanthosine triphosphatase